MSISTEEELAALRHEIRRMSQHKAVEGKQISDHNGTLVLEQTTTAGDIVAVKVWAPRSEIITVEREHDEHMFVEDPSTYVLQRTEAEMMHYAAVNGIRTPKVLGVYDVMHVKPEKPTALAMVSERVPGDTLHYVWGDLTDDQKSSVKSQLRTQIARMRTLTQPFIGRLGCKATFSPYEVYETNTFGPFPDEEKFDEWCLRRLRCGPSGERKWRKCLERQRRQSSGKFVLTHGNLSPRNILYKDGVVTGIIDWEMSGSTPSMQNMPSLWV